MEGLFWCLDPTIVPCGSSKLHCPLSVSLVDPRCRERTDKDSFFLHAVWIMSRNARVCFFLFKLLALPTCFPH